MKFCANPLCQHHVEVLYGSSSIVTRGANSKENMATVKHISRNKYCTYYGDSIFLCEVCSKAINMVSR